MIEDSATKSFDSTDAALRKSATLRSWICPGAGFALIGKSTLAVASFIVSLSILPAAAWLSFQPSAASTWTTVAIVAISIFLGLAEQFVIKKSKIQTPKIMVQRGFIAATCTFLLAAITALVLLFMSFGSLRIAGSGMAPTLVESERIVYYKKVDLNRVQKGSVIVFKISDDSGWKHPNATVVSRVLAVPGDSISIQDNQYLVNGVPSGPVAVTGKYSVALDVPQVPESLSVPLNCYFVVQESPTRGLDSRVLSWVREDKIVGVQIWYLASRGILAPVE